MDHEEQLLEFLKDLKKIEAAAHAKKRREDAELQAGELCWDLPQTLSND